MVISDEAMLAGDTFTQLSERWHSTSWLDHCLSTSDGHNLITAMHVQYGTSCRDHIPLIVDISMSLSLYFKTLLRRRRRRRRNFIRQWHSNNRCSLAHSIMFTIMFCENMTKI